MTEPKFRKKTGAHAPKSDAEGKLRDSAQQIWMAGLGAFSRAQDQGTKLLEALVREGQTIESRTRTFASGRADGVRDKVENTVSNVKERAADTWDRLEKVFEDRVSRALTRLGVPGREEMQALVDRVEQLNRSVREKQPPARGAAPAARKAASKPPRRNGARAPVKKAASVPARKTPIKSVSRAAAPKVRKKKPARSR